MKAGQTRHVLYLAGHVDETGYIIDPVFIRELKYLPESSDVPRNCLAVTESYDGRYWSNISDDIYSDHRDTWRKGDFCTAAYHETPEGGKIVDYLCELTQDVTSETQDHVAGILHTYSGSRLFEVDDICVSDLSDIY